MLRVTLRGIRAHLARLVLTALVVLMGVAFVVSVQVLTDTLQAGFDSVFADVGQGIEVVVRSSETTPGAFGGEQRAAISEDVLQATRQAPQLRTAVGVVQAPTRVVGPDRELVETVGGAPMFGVSWIDDPILSQWRIIDGRSPTAEGDVVVDAALATEKGLIVGTQITIPTATANEAFTVVGVATFGKARNFAGASAVLFETSVAQRLFVEPGKYNFIAGSAIEGVDQEQLTASVRTSVGVNRKAQVLTGEQYVKEGQDAIQRLFEIINSLLAAFGYIGLFVCAFIISNTFSIVVAQRSRELALLRALGASRRQVVLSVISEAVVVGTVASAVGLGAGVVFGGAVTTLLAGRGFVPPDAPLTVLPLRFVLPFFVGLTVTLISSLIPAWRASRIAPVAAMRAYAVEPRRGSKLRLVFAAVFGIAGAASMAAGLLGTLSQGQLAIFGGMAAVFLGVAGLAPKIVPTWSRVLGRPIRALRGITGRLAWENAARSPKRSAATSSAVMIGVGLVCFIAILGESFRATTTDAIDQAVQGDFVVNTRSVGQQGVSPKLTAELAEQPGVQAAAGLRVGLGTFDFAPALVLGADPAAFAQVVRLQIDAGDLNALGADGFAITSDEAQKKGWTIGTKVTAKFPDKPGRELTVRAIFTSDLLRGTNGYVVDMRLFEEVFPPTFQTDLQVYIKLAPGADPATMRARLSPIVKAYPPSKLEDLTEFKATRTRPIDNFVFFLWAMLTLAVVISLLGIVNTLLLAVVERTREIGLLRASGMSRRQVRATVRWEAVILALLGAVLGFAVGIFFGWAVVYAFKDEGLTTFAIPWGQLAMIFVLAAIAGVLTAVWPAHRAASLDILDAIAHD